MKISIIVPIYKIEKVLSRCLDSLVNQTLEDIEVILVNDGSPDNSKLVMEEYKKRYPDKVFCFYKENGGLSDARNFGLGKATGQYILYVDGDDYIEKNTCEVMYNIAKNNDLDILLGEYLVEKDGNIVRKYKRNKDLYDKIFSGREFIKNNLSQSMYYPVMVWLNLYKRSFLLSEGIKFKKGILHEDTLWTPQILLKSKKIMCIEFNFYHYILSNDSITQKKEKSKNAIDVFNSCYELEKIYSKEKDEILKRLLYNSLVTTYLYGFYIGKMYRKELKKYVRKEFLNDKPFFVKTKVKVFMFKINMKLYYFLNSFIKGVF